MEFKAGQKYIVGCEACSEHGNIIQITEIEGHRCNYKTIKGEHPESVFSISSAFAEYLIPCKEKIIITTDGKTTTARLYEGDKSLIKTAEAKCSPSDTFNFETGAKLAFERLFAEEKAEEKAIEAPAFKVGDKVRIIGHTGLMHFYDTNEIVTIENIDKDGDLQCVSSRGIHQSVSPVAVELVNETAFDWEAFKRGEFMVKVTDKQFEEFRAEAKKHGCSFPYENINPFDNTAKRIRTVVTDMLGKTDCLPMETLVKYNCGYLKLGWHLFDDKAVACNK